MFAASAPDFAKMRWFRNVRAGQPFDQGSISTDYALQLSMGIQNFEEWKGLQGGIVAATPQATAGAPAVTMMLAPGTDAEAAETVTIGGVSQFRVTRGQ
jgi:hypothetical protein